MRNAQHVYAIIRCDDFLAEFGIEARITVKKIVWTIDEAKSEVERLNNLRKGKNSRYFWQLTRLVDK